MYQCWRMLEILDDTTLVLFADYIKEVELARDTHQRESRAKEKEAFGDVNVKGVGSVFAMLTKEGQLPMYYSGGLRLLADDMRQNGRAPR